MPIHKPKDPPKKVAKTREELANSLADKMSSSYSSPVVSTDVSQIPIQELTPYKKEGVTQEAYAGINLLPLPYANTIGKGIAGQVSKTNVGKAMLENMGHRFTSGGANMLKTTPMRLKDLPLAREIAESKADVPDEETSLLGGGFKKFKKSIPADVMKNKPTLYFLKRYWKSLGKPNEFEEDWGLIWEDGTFKKGFPDVGRNQDGKLKYLTFKAIPEVMRLNREDRIKENNPDRYNKMLQRRLENSYKKQDTIKEKQIEKTQNTINDLLNFQLKQTKSPEYLKRVMKEYDVQSNVARQIVDERVDKLNTLSYRPSDNLPENVAAFYNNMLNLMEFAPTTSEGLSGSFSHEVSHLKDNVRWEDVGFQNLLSEIYKEKGLIKDIEQEDVMHTENVIRLIREEKNKRADEFREKFSPPDAKDLHEMLPSIGNYNGAWIDNKTNKFIGNHEEDVKKYISENYPPDLFKDVNNWQEEMKNYRRLGESDWRKGFNIMTPEQEEYEREIVNNPIFNKSKDSKYADEIKYYTDNYLSPNIISTIFNNENMPEWANKIQEDYYSNLPTKVKTNMDFNALRESFDEEVKNKNLSDGLLEYHFKPTEIKARLRAIRDYAVRGGYKIGTDIFRHFERNPLENENVRDQLFDLQRINKLENKDINRLMNMFGQNNTKNNTLNLLNLSKNKDYNIA